jgi:hypothetical protein
MNMNRIAVNIAAVLVVAIGFMGYRLYLAETQKEAVTKEFESYKLEHTTRLSAAEKALTEDEGRITHEMNKTDEAVQRLKMEEQRRAVAEEQLRRLEAARQGSGRLESTRVYDDRQQMPIVSQQTHDRQISQTEPDESQGPRTTMGASEAGGHAIAVRTRIHAHSTAQVPLARVHAGDQVTLRVRRVGQANGQLLVGLGPAVRDSSGKYSNGLLGGRRTLSKPIKDQDRFVVSFDLLSTKKGRFKLNTEHGAILYIGAETPRSSQTGSGETEGAGYYDVELMIRQHNRWAIAPESLA